MRIALRKRRRLRVLNFLVKLVAHAWPTLVRSKLIPKSSYGEGPYFELLLGTMGTLGSSQRVHVSRFIRAPPIYMESKLSNGWPYVCVCVSGGPGAWWSEFSRIPYSKRKAGKVYRRHIYMTAP